MDEMFIKPEENSTKRRVISAERGTSDGNEGVKIVKRRRRTPPAMTSVRNSGEMMDQSTTGITNKRSSRFRGVSR